MNLIEKRGSWFSFGDTQIGQGREQTKKAIDQDKNLEAQLMAKIREKIPGRSAAPAPTSDDGPMIEDEEAIETEG